MLKCYLQSFNKIARASRLEIAMKFSIFVDSNSKYNKILLEFRLNPSNLHP